MKDMVERLRPAAIVGPANLQAIDTKDPRLKTGSGRGSDTIIPGSGTSFTPDRQPKEPKKPHKLRNTLLVTGALGAAGTGAYVATQGETETSPTTAPVVTTIDIEPTNPSDPVIIPTIPSTTEAPTTTVPERVFASPEQQAQVEAVEKNIELFFGVTKQDVLDYGQHTAFMPYVSGFSTIKISPSPNDNSYRMLGINLGTLSVQTGDTLSTLVALGYVTVQGDKFVQLTIQDVNDPEFIQHFPGSKTNAGAVTLKPIGQDGGVVTFGVDSVYLTTDNVIPSKRVVGSDNLIAALNRSEIIGAPVIAEYFTNADEQTKSAGYVVEPNPSLKSIINDLNSAAKTRSLDETIAQYTPQELEAVGVMTQAGFVPNNLLNFASLPNLLHTLPYGGVLVFLDNIARII